LIDKVENHIEMKGEFDQSEEIEATDVPKVDESHEEKGKRKNL
jgi:hypothetical protein